MDRDLQTNGDFLDQRVIDYTQHLYDDEEPKSTSSTLLSALHDKYPQLKAQKMLAASWRAQSAWDPLEPGDHRLPWPEELVGASSSMAIFDRRPGYALGYMLCWHGLLRPGELCGLNAETLRLPSVRRSLHRKLGIAILQRPKTRNRLASTQHVVIDDPNPLDLLTLWKALHASKLFPSYSEWYRWTRAQLTLLQLTAYSLGGLRAGGATARWLAFFDLGVLRRRGRWTAERTLQSYV